MATVETENLPSPSSERPIGFGRLKRKEDPRFIRGQGTYLTTTPNLFYASPASAHDDNSQQQYST